MDLKSLHRIRSATLENGLRIYVNHRDNAPVVTIQAWVRTGSVHEEEYLGCGLSHFLEHMLFHGSSRYTGAAITETVHRLGGDMNAFTSFDHTVYYLDLPAEHLTAGIDILTDMLVSPTFPEDKFQDEKSIILRERDMHGDSPSRVLSEKIWHDAFTIHPARHPIIGYHHLIATVDRPMMVDYYRRRYSPERVFLLVSGRLDPEETIAALSARTASWPRADLREPYLPVEPPQLCRRENIYYYPDPLVRHGLVWPIPESGHADIPALDVFCSILGQNRSSRLNRTMKVERELTLNIGSFCYTPSFCGILGITAVSSADRAEAMEAALLEEIDRVTDGGFSERELEREVVQLTTEYLRTMRSNGSAAKVLGNCILNYGSPDFVGRYLEQLRALTPDDIARVARQYLRPERLSLTRLLPEDSRGRLFAPPVQPMAATETYAPELRRFPSGHRLVLCRDASLPLVDLTLIMPGGAFFENRAEAGVSLLVSTLLPTGAGDWDEMEIMQQLDDFALEFTASPGSNSLTLRFNCHRDHLLRTMELMRAMLTRPRFAPELFRREQQAAIEKLRSRRESPQNLADDRMLEIMFGDHPYAVPPHGTIAGIEALNAAKVRAFFEQVCLRPEQMVFGAAGDFDPEAIAGFVAGLIPQLPWRGGAAAAVPPPRFSVEPQRTEVVNSRSQAVVVKALPGCDNRDERRYAVDLLQTVMNGQGSQLFRKIRDEAGLAYYTGMITARGFHPGYLSLYAGTSAEHAAEVEEMLTQEIDRLAKDGMTEEEFQAGRAGLDYGESEQQDNVGVMLLHACLSEYYGNGCRAPFRQREIYRALTREEVNATVRNMFAARGTVTVICCPDEAE